MADYGFRINVQIGIFKMLYKPLVRRSARQILQGRMLDPAQPEKGRWLARDVSQMLKLTWQRVDGLLGEAELDLIPTVGNRNNVFLAVLTTAAYQVLLDAGQGKARAAELVADVGWKIYEMGVRLVSLPFRLTRRDQGRRIEGAIDALLVFPFNAPGRPGYEVCVRKLDGQMLTDWTRCPPQAFVRKLIEQRGDKGELEAFYRSWCLYDWPGADIIAGDGKRGHYRRKKTMSRGDGVCDMCWRHKVR